MEIIVGKNAGFCFGVQRAVNGAVSETSKNKEIYCLGEIVHNKQVVEDLEKLGIKFIDDIKQGKNKVIIRAHGVEKKVYDQAKKLNIKLIDYTCPKVLHIHEIAEEYSLKGYYILLIGKKDHPETIGTISYCGSNFYTVENINDIDNAIQSIKNSKIKNVLVISQTTYSLGNFELIVNKIKETLVDNYNLEIKNTICGATKLRQEETTQLAKTSDAMLIIGSKSSSNTNKLYETAIKYCKAYLIENKEEIKVKELGDCKKVSIMAGASTPKKSIDEAIEILASL